MTFFENELMKMFGKNAALTDIRCVGNALVGRLTPDTIAKITFASSIVHGEYPGVSIRVINPTSGEVDRHGINFCDAFGRSRKEGMQRNSTNDLQQTVAAESNLQDVAQLAADMHRNREPLLHTAVFLEMISDTLDNLRILQTEVQTELVRSKLNVDRLMLRQQHGFMSVMPSGRNMFREQFERVLPASSVANLYPFSFSGKTDENGFYLGRDKFGSNIIVDFDKRSDDKTNGATRS